MPSQRRKIVVEEEEDIIVPSSNPMKEESETKVLLPFAIAGDGPTRRLMIEKMVCENFKSYAGVQTIGTFHPSFTAVVGPNGSGKSNIFDAMLFVFGFRSNKIRLKKLSELVHHSEAHPNLTQARVSVHFKEILDYGSDSSSSHVEEIPGSEMVLTRTVDKSANSNYYLNGEKMKLKEVTELLMSKGIDLDHNRFLILQGEVEQISLMKPKAQTEHEEGMLEYIEDIIGSNKYLPDIEGSQKRLETANEERTEKLNRVKVVEKEKENLEGAKLEAEEYLHKENQILDKQVLLTHLRNVRVVEKLKEGEERKTQLEAELEEKKKEVTETKTELASMEEKHKKDMNEFETLKQEMTKAKSNFSVYERKDVKLREDIKHSAAKEKKLQSSIEKDKKKLREKKAEVKRQEEDVIRFEQEIQKLTKELSVEEAKMEKIYSGLKGEVAELQVELESKQKELAPWSKKVNEEQAALDLARSELDLLLEKRNGPREVLEAAKTRLQELIAKIEERKKDSKSNPQQSEEAKKRLAVASKKLQQNVSQDEALLEEIRTTKTRLEEAKNSANETKGRSRLLKALHEAKVPCSQFALPLRFLFSFLSPLPLTEFFPFFLKARKVLVGIHGRLGDLGTISDKYDVAISTACPALEHIVVDNGEVGSKVLQYLRDNELGRATLVLLSEVESKREGMKKIVTPEGVPRLFDLVKSKDEKFLPAFYFALGNTLVANDLDQATRIAYSKESKFRVVSLDGAVIDTSGTMSGGGTQVIRGAMSSHGAANSEPVSPAEMANLERTLQAANKRALGLREEKQQLEAEIQGLKETIAKLELDVRKAEMDVQGLATQRDELKATIPKLTEDAEATKGSDGEKVTALEKLVKKHTEALKKHVASSSKLAALVQELQSRMLEVGGVRLQAQKSKVESITNQIDQLNTSITKTNVQNTSTLKLIEKTTKAIEDYEADIKKISKEVEKFKEELEQLESDAAAVLQVYQETETLLEEKAEQMKGIQKEYDRLKKVC
jgi:structural maintenance of chromosome 4